jgi:hypothetical protein
VCAPFPAVSAPFGQPRPVPNWDGHGLDLRRVQQATKIVDKFTKSIDDARDGFSLGLAHDCLLHCLPETSLCCASVLRFFRAIGIDAAYSKYITTRFRRGSEKYKHLLTFPESRAIYPQPRNAQNKKPSFAE